MSKVSKSILYLVYYVLVIGLGSLIVVAFTQDHSTPLTIHPSISNKPTQIAQSKEKPKTESSNKTNDSKKKSAQPPKASTPAPAVTPGSTLENTGPGSVTGLFIGSSIIGAVVYRQLLVRKIQNKNR